MSIYLDNGATTKIRPEALEKYIEVSRDCYGNPSSLHSMGHLAEKELDAARKTVLSTLKDTQSAVVFTASGSEANNLAIFGRAFSKERYRRGAKIITTNGEHASVDAPLEKLKALGFEIVRIPTLGGRIDMDVLSSALDKNTILVTMMMVNNETGALYDVASVSRLMRAKAPEAYLHVDATQSYLKIPFTKKSLGADMITLSSHKIEGPKGVG
ncbi:MAG: aminotransferase class V-fold PLP-dependent enzyme, partial [Clostridia bacterium]|nr:aminotransferase class V-fold PLP-dependent enzyme [Clostridia bacterium]